MEMGTVSGDVNCEDMNDLVSSKVLPPSPISTALVCLNLESLTLITLSGGGLLALRAALYATRFLILFRIAY